MEKKGGGIPMVGRGKESLQRSRKNSETWKRVHYREEAPRRIAPGLSARKNQGEGH